MKRETRYVRTRRVLSGILIAIGIGLVIIPLSAYILGVYGLLLSTIITVLAILLNFFP